MDTTKWTTKIDFLTSEFKKSFSRLTEEQLNWKPNPETWSIAQNIAHIMTVNRDYFPVIDNIQSANYKTPLIGKISFLTNMFGKFILNAVEPGRKKKMKTAGKWNPQESQYPADILNQFEEQQAKLKQMINKCSDLLDKNIVISSPAMKSIVYKLDTAFDIIVNHEERHLNQAREVSIM